VITEDQLEQLCLGNKKSSHIPFSQPFAGYNPDSWPVMVSWLVPTKR